MSAMVIAVTSETSTFMFDARLQLITSTIDEGRRQS